LAVAVRANGGGEMQERVDLLQLIRARHREQARLPNMIWGVLTT
jgi:hypothetical protein